MRDVYDGREIELFGKHQHRLVFVFTTHDAGRDDKPQEWMRAIYASMRGWVHKENYDDPNMLKMFEVIKEDNLTPDERAEMKEEYNRAEAVEQARDEGLKKGRDEGEHKLEETARNLLALGTLSVAQVTNATGLTLERVKELSTL